MKKIYLSLAGLVICGSIISQNIINMQDHINKQRAILPANAKLPLLHPNNSGSRVAGPFSMWTEPIGDIMTNKGLNLNGSANADAAVFVDMIYQDSTVTSSSQSGKSYISSILLGTVLDPTSTLLQASNDPIVTKNDSYSIDSLTIYGSYVKVTSAIDTLYTWLVWGDSSNTAVFNKRLDNATWNAPIGTWRHSVIGPKITGATGAAGNKVKPAAPSTNMKLIKYALQNTDSVGSGGFVKNIIIPLPSVAVIPAGNIVSCFFTFVPGGTYAPGDVSYNLGGTAPQTINGFAAGVWGQLNPAVTTLTDYVDQQVDLSSWCMGASYDKGQRHNLYPTTWSTFMAGDLTTAPVIGYKISGTSTLGVSELEKNGFALTQNQPNPFHNQTTINYQIKKTAENVTLQIFDIRGVKLYEKTELNVKAGNYSETINNVNFSSGLYFYSLSVDGAKVTKKMIAQ